ncbi:MAG: 4Fe-4S binding protein [Thermoplasmata archaeon]
MKAKEIVIDRNLCKGCSICVHVCPKKTLGVSNDVNEYGLFYPKIENIDTCIVCRLCELYCPDFAIEVVEA